jgi:hypothetical protein
LSYEVVLRFEANRMSHSANNKEHRLINTKTIPRMTPVFAISALAILLTACGGGGGSAGGGPVQASPAGLYNGTGATRAFTVLVLDTGRYYALYGPTGGSTSVIAGVIVGDGTASGSTFASANLHDFSLKRA